MSLHLGFHRLRVATALCGAGLLLFTTACVSGAKYRQLDETAQKTQTDLNAAVFRVQELEERLGMASNERNELQASLLELRRRRADAEKRIAEYRELTAKFQSLVSAGKLSVKVVGGRMVVALSSDILFASGSAKLSREGQQAIVEVAALLKQLPDRNFQIEGHTDNQAIRTATFPSNWELAAARALTVLKGMLAAGMEPATVSAASFADTRPAVSNDLAAGRASNRRIEIAVVPDLSKLPGFEELEKFAGDGSRDAGAAAPAPGAARDAGAARGAGATRDTGAARGTGAPSAESTLPTRSP